MNFKSENGFTGIDVTVAIIIIMLFMTLIATVFYNITLSSKKLERKTEATYIAMDTIEKIKALDYNNMSNDGDNVSKIIENANSTEGYTTSVDIKKYLPEGTQSTEENDVIKTIQVIVQYKIGKNIEKVELNTSVTRGE